MSCPSSHSILKWTSASQMALIPFSSLPVSFFGLTHHTCPTVLPWHLLDSAAPEHSHRLSAFVSASGVGFYNFVHTFFLITSLPHSCCSFSLSVLSLLQNPISSHFSLPFTYTHLERNVVFTLSPFSVQLTSQFLLSICLLSITLDWKILVGSSMLY